MWNEAKIVFSNCFSRWYPKDAACKNYSNERHRAVSLCLRLLSIQMRRERDVIERSPATPSRAVRAIQAASVSHIVCESGEERRNHENLISCHENFSFKWNEEGDKRDLSHYSLIQFQFCSIFAVSSWHNNNSELPQHYQLVSAREWKRKQ